MLLSMEGTPPSLRLSSSMRNLLASERSKWIFVIGVVAIGAGFTAKNVISYPTECLPEKALELTQLIRPLVWNAKITTYTRTWNCCYRSSLPLLKANRFRTIAWGHNFEGRKLNFLFPSCQLHCYQPVHFTPAEFIEILLNAIKITYSRFCYAFVA